MSIDNQIEEMAKTLGIAFQLAGITRFSEVAEVLVNAGYRKASEVAREIFEEIEKIVNKQYNRSLFGIVTDITPEIAELKKKYTEDNK